MPARYFGKYTGIVRDNRDDQLLGHLQVVVPAIFPEEEIVIARPALPYGFFFVPEKDAKVWIEFEGGDPGLPIWTGIQYVQGEWAPEAEADPPEKRVVKTASGHLVVFNDTGGEESIEIKDGKSGHTITLDKEGIKVRAKDKTVAIDAGSGEIKVTSASKVVIDAPQIELVDGASHPAPKFDEFLQAFGGVWTKLLVVLQAGTAGSPAAQQLAGLPAALPDLQAFGAKLSAGVPFQSQKVKNG
ncbi:phage baseplate assembly protein V [Sorangium sp. So ce216]